MTINSRNKGASGEREFAACLEAMGIRARRGRQYHGLEGKDVVTSLPGVHFEVKRTERLRLDEAFFQAMDDAGDDIPVVAHRKNRTNWKLTVKLEDIPRLLHVFSEAMEDRHD